MVALIIKAYTESARSCSNDAKKEAARAQPVSGRV